MLDARLARRLEDVDGADDVDLRVAVGSSMLRLLPTQAARWKTVPQPSIASATAQRIADVALDEAKPGKAVEILAVARHQVVEHVTDQPSPSKRRKMFDPMKPAPPVTKALTSTPRFP